MLGRGIRIAAYEIVDALGAGDMGEVYRALDPTLDRFVAIKILPPVFAADLDRVVRFQREAEMLATINRTPDRSPGRFRAAPSAASPAGGYALRTRISSSRVTVAGPNLPTTIPAA